MKTENERNSTDARNKTGRRRSTVDKIMKAISSVLFLGLVSLLAFSAQSGNAQVFNEKLGTGALQSNTTGSYNVALGDYTLLSSTTGSSNAATGIQLHCFIMPRATKTLPAARLRFSTTQRVTRIPPAECAPSTRTRKASITRPAVSGRFSLTIPVTIIPPAVSTPSGRTPPAPPTRPVVTRRSISITGMKTPPAVPVHSITTRRATQHCQRSARTIPEHPGLL